MKNTVGLLKRVMNSYVNRKEWMIQWCGWSWFGESMPSPIEESLRESLGLFVWLRVHPVGMVVIRFLWAFDWTLWPCGLFRFAVRYCCWWFRNPTNQQAEHTFGWISELTVDGRNSANHLGCIKPGTWRAKLVYLSTGDWFFHQRYCKCL